MTAREKLQMTWDMAFSPSPLNVFCATGRDSLATKATPDFLEILDDAYLLHLALPESGYASQSALERLALAQARSRAYGMPSFIANVRRALGRPDLLDLEVPPRLVRDIAITPIRRTNNRPKTNT